MSDVDWLNGELLVERGIVAQQVDGGKTPESRKKLVIDGETAHHATGLEAISPILRTG